jgi:serine/threonine-protein kinase
LERGGEAASRQALEHFSRAVAIDSTYAPAYAGLALSYIGLGMWGSSVDPEGVRDPARNAALHAIERDSMLAEAHLALGEVKWLFDWDWAGAEAAFKRGMELNPTSSPAIYAYGDFLTSQWRARESLPIQQRAVDLDPLSPLAYNGVAFALENLGRYDEAIAQWQKAIALAPNFAIFHLVLAESYILSTRLREATKELEEAERLFRQAGDRSWFGLLAWAYGQVHRRKDAFRIIAEMNPTPVGWKSVAYLGVDDKENALRFLEAGFQRHEVPMVYIWARHIFDPIRDDPRYQSVIRRMRFPERLKP